VRPLHPQAEPNWTLPERKGRGNPTLSPFFPHGGRPSPRTLNTHTPKTAAPATTYAAPATPAPAPAPPSFTPIPEVVVGPAAWALAVEAGAAKAATPLGSPTVALGLLAGVCIGFGASLAFAVGGAVGGLAGGASPGLARAVFGLYGFPAGLLAIALLGGELFTGNAFLFAAGAAEGRVAWRAALPRLAAVWVANGLGCAAVAAAMVAGGAPVLAGPGVAAAAAAKASLPLAPAFARAVLCNILVCTAVLGASAARSLPGKAVGILFPLSAFASLGLEHCIANQFVFALASLTGAPFSGAGALANLAVVTAGNVVGGAGVLAGLMAVGHGSLGKKWRAASA
jgi:formate/nitrite transporter